MRERWTQRNTDTTKDVNASTGGTSTASSSSSSISEVLVEVNKSDAGRTPSPMPTTTAGALRPFALGLRKPSNPTTNAGPVSPSGSVSSLVSRSSGSGPSGISFPTSPPPVGAALASWGAGIGSFISTRLAKQPLPQGSENERHDSASSRGSLSSAVEGREGKGKGKEGQGEERRDKTVEPVEPQPMSAPRINVTSPGSTTPSAVLNGTPPSAASTVGKSRGTPTGLNGAGGRVRAAVMEKEKGIGQEWNPKDVTTGVRLSPTEGDKSYRTKNLIDSPPYRATSISMPEEVNSYLERKGREAVDHGVQFTDPFTALSKSDDTHHELPVDPVKHGSTVDGLHRGSTGSNAYSHSIKSVDEEEAYAGMAL